MELKSDEDEEETKLDLEFRKILRIIKIYIPCIMNAEYLTLYRIWLEKLSDVGKLEKYERNRYLVELCRQIQDGSLEKPFINTPGSGPLPPFSCSGKDLYVIEEVPSGNQRSSPSKNSFFSPKSQPKTSRQTHLNNGKCENYLKELSKIKHMVHNVEQTYPDNVEHSSIFEQELQKKRINQLSSLKDLHKNIIREKSLDFSKLIQNETNRQFLQKQSYVPAKHNLQEQLNSSYYGLDTFPSSYYRKNSQHAEIKLKQKHFVSGDKNDNEEEDDESSWFDMSEVSRTTARTALTVSRMESGDSATEIILHDCPEESNPASQCKIHEKCETKINDLIEIVSELKNQNLTLNTKAEGVIQTLSDEIKMLKNKVQKFEDAKSTLKKNQMVVLAQCQLKINALNKKLQNAQKENETLQEEIDILKKNLDDTAAKKRKDSVASRQRLAELYNKEIEMLKQNYVKHIVDIENKFTRILIEKENVFNRKLNDLRELYDRKISNVNKGKT